MFEDFSSGYYLGRLYVEPHDGDRTVMLEDEFEEVSGRLYSDEDAPLVMKLESQHLRVEGDGGVPSATLAVPRSVLDETEIRNPPALKEVLLAKPGYASKILRLGLGSDSRTPS